ncbi:hypothetical protein GGR58DRAFT_492798 [Xylaria digitata]|nr:hypothetical protein GGR58DRAFT_492798 [Xylaria digitata]
MSFNRILSKSVVGSAIKDGKRITLSVATETSHWKRPDVSIDPVGNILQKSLENYKPALPAGTTDVCLRESVHQSDADKRDHLTVVCIKENGDVQTVHIPVEK